jgi:CHASE2 domain-containing sensor protein
MRKRRFVWRKFRRYFLAGLGWMVLISLLHELADQSWLVKRLETANLDALFSGKERSVSKDVMVVSITDDDYVNEFGGVSPLNPEKLKEFIDLILAEKPKALGVDFDTSTWPGPESRYQGKRIVWAREALGEAGSLTMGKVLGGAEGNFCYGVPAYFPDEDGIVREYKEFIKGADGQYYPSLAFNLIQTFQGLPCSGHVAKLEKKQSDEAEKVNFRGPKNVFDHFSIGSLRKFANFPRPQPLEDKIVLLGGAYRAARDAYPTPFRYMDGVDIIANTVDMNVPGNTKLNESPHWIKVLGYAQAVALLAGLYFVSRTWSMAIILLTGPVYAILVNWLAFQWAATFVSFVPAFVGLVIHEIVEHTIEYHHLQKENHELHEQVNHLRTAAHHK